MELIFNELSLIDKASNKYGAIQLMNNLLLTYNEAKKRKFKGLRIRTDFKHQELCDNYTIFDWLKDKSVREKRDIFIGDLRTPYIEDGNEKMVERFIFNAYLLNMPELNNLHKKKTEGLAVAYILNTLSISLDSNNAWNKTTIDLFERNDITQKDVTVNHVVTPEDVNSHEQWINDNLPILLVTTNIIPEKKKISLSDHHGKDILNKFADGLVKSPYVREVIHSIEMDSLDKYFIKNIYPDGKIEIRLTWTNRGLGLKIQTTGRNIQETNRIAEIIEAKYNK